MLVAAIAGGALLRTLGSHKPLRVPPLGGFVLTFCAVVVLGLFQPGRDLAGERAGRAFASTWSSCRCSSSATPSSARTPSCRRSCSCSSLCAAAGGVVSYIQSTLTPEQFANWGPGYRERIFGNGVISARLAYGDGGVASVRPFGLGSDIGAGAVAAALALPALWRC